MKSVLPPDRKHIEQPDLTIEEDTAACALALELLGIYLAERGQIAE